MGGGVACHFRGEAGCTIYPDRPPNPCKSFECEWLRQGSLIPEEFRPDRVGAIIIEKLWRDRVALKLVSAGCNPDPKLLDWMRTYSAEHQTPFVYEMDGVWRGFGMPEFQQDMLERHSRGEELLP